MLNKLQIKELKSVISGELYTDIATKILYATDASVYRELPVAIVIPKDKNDVFNIIKFAKKNKLTLIPRGCGTSLAGQVVGNGIVIDISKYFNKILEINELEQWVRVEPGVVLDELNKQLEKHNLFFAPETSTSNRCVIGGMVGNNSCGSHSLIYGSVREHLIATKAFLSSGKEVVFGEINKTVFDKKCNLTDLEGDIYKQIKQLFTNENIINEINEQFPDKSLKRRNSGYAIDELYNSSFFANNSETFNFSKLIAGSEGTLCFFTELKLNLTKIKKNEKAVICVHCNSLNESFNVNLIALNYNPIAIELIDKTIISCAKNNIKQKKNSGFINGEPAAVVAIELSENSANEIENKIGELIKIFKIEKLGYSYPVLYNNDINKIWDLRKAGLGLLSNIKGDGKPIAVVEDTAITPKFLANYVTDFDIMLNKYNLHCVYYGHISTGELHLRPVLNLKLERDKKLFYIIAKETALLVKKYKGSLSGEHGDGRLRGKFIPIVLSKKIYHVFKEIKNIWDYDNIFNYGKIINTENIVNQLRYNKLNLYCEPKTIYNYSSTDGFLRAVEQCNGSGDCRKSAEFKGVMCPSYKATNDEHNSTRARANILREFIAKNSDIEQLKKSDVFNILDLCLSCKGCKAECPSNVDITKYKTEFLNLYNKNKFFNIRSRIFANIHKINNLGYKFKNIYNFIISNYITSNTLKFLFSISLKRKLPLVNSITLKEYYKKKYSKINTKNIVYLFADEFTNYNDVEIGIKAIKILNKLGFEVIIPELKESGRTYISKGFLSKAKKIANYNINFASKIINYSTPLIGIEPSALLTFRDEYIDLANDENRKNATKLANNCFTFEEFICKTIDNEQFENIAFNKSDLKINIHSHCYQKALSSTSFTLKMLNFISLNRVSEIGSTCCGMAGSFGFEKEHYDVSMKIGELKLFPEIRNLSETEIIVASGTSCRQQIKDGTGKTALHPIEIFYNSLFKN